MTTTVFVHTRNSAKGRWSRYLFPFSIDAFAQLANDLYIRSGDTIKRVSEQATSDVHNGATVGFPGTVQWAWLEFGQPGVTKMLEGFDVVASGTPSISVGYDQRNLDAFTDPYAIPADTIPGDMIPLPVSGPTLSVKLDFAAGTPWSLQQVLLYLHDNRAGS